MGDRLELAEPEEPTRALDGVQDAEDLGEGRRVVGRGLEDHESLLDALQALVALGEEFADDLVIFFHVRSLVWVGGYGVDQR